MRIEIGPILAMHSHDTVLLASDGVSDNLHVKEIVECARKGPLTEVVRSIAAAAGRRMQTSEGPDPSKPDDMTFIAFRLTPPPPSRSNARR